MLTSHKNIVIPPECGFAVWFYDKYRGWGEPDLDSKLDSFMDDLLSSRKIEHWRLDRADLLEFISKKRPCSYPQLVACVYECYGRLQGRTFTRWGDKNNFHIHHIATLRTMFPTAFFVHIVRDGRDVASSYKRLAEQQIDSQYAPRLPDQVEKIAEQWRKNIRAVVGSFDKSGWRNVCEVRFEDLILNPVTTLQNLCDSLGEEYDPSMLNYHVLNAEHELEPREMLQWKSKNLKPPIPAEVGRYKDELSEEEVRVFQRIAGSEMIRYGYSNREAQA
jgi:hypothetical protein